MNAEELLECIKQAARNHETQLNLRGRGITELPAEIGQLTNLTRLDLYHNRLTRPPSNREAGAGMTGARAVTRMSRKWEFKISSFSIATHVQARG